MDGINLDVDSGIVMPEEFLVHAKNKLVIPRWVVTTFNVNTRGKFPRRVDPRGRVGLHFLGNVFQVLRGNDVYFQELERFQHSHILGNWWHFHDVMVVMNVIVIVVVVE